MYVSYEGGWHLMVIMLTVKDIKAIKDIFSVNSITCRGLGRFSK